MAEPTIPDWVSPEARLVLARLDQVGAAMAVTQNQLDAYAAQVNDSAAAIQTATSGIAADLQALKDSLPADVDTTALDANLARLTQAAAVLASLDAENPPPPGP
jgi:hypothetical protein